MDLWGTDVGVANGRPSFDREYAADRTSPAQARRAVDAWLVALKIDGLRRDHIALAVSEACTNAVLHARTDRPFAVRAHVEDGSVTLTVADRGAGLGAGSPQAGLGRGLEIMARLCTRLDLTSAATGLSVTMRFEPSRG